MEIFGLIEQQISTEICHFLILNLFTRNISTKFGHRTQQLSTIFKKLTPGKSPNRGEGANYYFACTDFVAMKNCEFCSTSNFPLGSVDIKSFPKFFSFFTINLTCSQGKTATLFHKGNNYYFCLALDTRNLFGTKKNFYGYNVFRPQTQSKLLNFFVLSPKKLHFID